MGHWYSKDGSPSHFKGPNKSATTLREARKLGLWPSVTAIGDILAKPALINWLQEQAALAAIQRHEDRHHRLIDRTWAKEVIAANRKKTMALADKGSDIHDILERWFSEDQPILDVTEDKLCVQVANLLVKHCGTQTWIPEQTFSHELGFGGKVDLHTRNPINDMAVTTIISHNNWTIDYKSKDGSVKDMRGYPNQAEQLVAYANGLGMPNARVANIFISRDRDLWGSPEGVSWYEHTDSMAWERFKVALSLWQISKRYGPAYEAVK